MALVPAPLHTLANAVYQHWQEKGSSEKARPYLGGSQIGATCERSLWYSFRWAESRSFDGRLYRLFNRGQREEAVIIEELRGIGCTVADTQPDGRQWGGSDLAGHFRWNLDAAIYGTLYSPKKWAVLEAKTHNTKSFKDLQDKGVEKSKPMHFAQCQVYMGQAGMERALYYAVCKDDDRIHTEWLHFDRAIYDKLMERARRIITTPEPPLRISNDSSWFECKWCDYSVICHGTAAPQVNCRTCAHSTPEMDGDGRWSCAIDGGLEPCDKHRYIPVLLEKFATLKDSDGDSVTYTNTLTGATFSNGDYSSVEIRAAQDKRALGDPGVESFRTTFGAKIAA